MIKNVIIVCDYAYVEGGASKVAIQTALALDKYTDYNVFFFAGNGVPCDQLQKSSITVHSLNMYDLLSNPNKIDASLKGIYNEKVGNKFKELLLTLNLSETIVHIHSWTKVLTSSIFKVCNELNVKTFLTIHDFFLTCPNGACYNFVEKVTCAKRPLSFECVKCNCDSRKYVHKLWRCIRQCVQNSIIKNFYNLNYIYISEFQRKQMKKRNPLIKNEFLLNNVIDYGNDFLVRCNQNEYFLFMGRVCKEKGIDLFCKAVQTAGVSGLVIGDGPLLPEMKKEFPNIKFVGWQEKEQINEWLNKTRAFVFTSLLYEGSPLSIPEVQAHGIPCIVTSGNAGTDNVINNVNGLIVNANVEDISNGIEMLKDDNVIKNMSENTSRNFDYSLGSERMYIKKLTDIYEK